MLKIATVENLPFDASTLKSWLPEAKIQVVKKKGTDLEDLDLLIIGSYIPKSILKTKAYIVSIWPDLSIFDTSREVLLGVETGWSYLAYAGLYGAGYCLVFLSIGMVAFQRRDLL